MLNKLATALVVTMTIGGAATPVLADDWQATKLRGTVLQLVDGKWQKLGRGDVVPDDRVVRTLKTGRVTFQRGEETIELAGETQVQIFDRSGRKFTTVKQYFGTVGVEAEVQNVEHFSVQTPYLTAVVKGTRFVVRSGEGGAEVDVDRGRVAVSDHESGDHTVVPAGHSVSTTAESGLELDAPRQDGSPPLPKAPQSDKPHKHAEDHGKGAGGGDADKRGPGEDKGGSGKDKGGSGGDGGHDDDHEDKPGKQDDGKRSENSGESRASNSGSGSSGSGSSNSGSSNSGSDNSGRGEGSGRNKGGHGKD